MDGRLGLLVLVAALACGDAREGWIARVDGATIPLQELRRAAETRIEEEPGGGREEILNQELNRLVSEQVIRNRARELGVTIGVPEAEERLRRLHGSQLRLDPELVEEARSEMLRERIALRELAARLQVEESALVHYFEENRERYHEPERVEIRQIVVEDRDRAERLLGLLRGGEDFARVARQNSLAPEAAEGGRLPPFAHGEMPEVFERAFDLRPGQLSEVLESPYGFHLLRLERRIPAHQPELDEVRERVRADLEQERLARLEREWLRGLLRKADIVINERGLDTLR